MAEVGGLAPSQPSPSSAAPARPFDAVGEFLVSLGVARRAARSARCGVHRRTPRCRSIKKGSEPESEAPPGLDHPSGAACRTGAAGNGLKHPKAAKSVRVFEPENREFTRAPSPSA